MTVRAPFFAALCCMFGAVAAVALLTLNLVPLFIWLIATLIAITAKEIPNATQQANH